MEIFNQIPKELINFILVLLFSFAIGVEQHKLNPTETERKTFGTDRTFTFIGLLGYVLILSDSSGLLPYIIGFVLLGCFLMIYYFMKIHQEKRFGLTTVLLGLIVYTFPLLIVQTPYWLSLLFFVMVLIFAEIKKPLRKFSGRVAEDEFLTLAKFIIIAGIILPLLSDKEISPYIPVSPHKIWLAVVVVSAISYLSYLLRRYIFPKAGLLLTGILGGLYSSTASTVILARKSKEDNNNPKMYAGSIIMATAMMFLRIYILLFIFNRPVGEMAWSYFLLLFLVSLAVGYFLYRSGQKGKKTNISRIEMEDKNPLEFRIALLFALLYIVFSALTEYVVSQFGMQGLSSLSIIVGVTDIDPFLLNLFQGHYTITPIAILIATMQAIASNNVLKTAYAFGLGDRKTARWTLKGFAVILAFNIAAIVLLYFFQ